MKALIVEDDRTSRIFLETVLSRYGECDAVSNGTQAVAAFMGAMEVGRRYDLICMDVMMPEIDGRETIRIIREREATAGIFSTRAKIIMTTALGDTADIASVNGLCDAYLVKPINVRRLLQELKTFRLVV
jgi:two-component system chemotaxis response regulator CheY